MADPSEFVMFDTAGRNKLKALGLGSSEIARRLGLSAKGEPVRPSLVSRWLNGRSRPDLYYQPALKELCGAEPEDWLTHHERNALVASAEERSRRAEADTPAPGEPPELEEPTASEGRRNDPPERRS